MNSFEISRTKNRRKSLQENCDKNELNISKIKNSRLRYSISSNKPSNNIYKILPTNKKIPSKKKNKKNSNENSINNLPSSSNKYFYLNSITNRNIEFNELYKKTGSFELKTNTQKLVKKYNFKLNEDNSFSKRKENRLNHSTNSALNTIENNIKKVIHKMKLELEEKAKLFQLTESVSPKFKRNKLTSTPNLKLYFSKKKPKNKHKKNLHESLLIEETNIDDRYNIFIKDIDKKRNQSQSFYYTEQAKNKILKKLKNKIYKLSNEKLTKISGSCETDSDNNKNLNGFSFHPNSNFIFVFDLLLIISNIYFFIFIPLYIAQNKDVRVKESIYKEFLHYLIDLIFLSDFILGFFRGFYNYEMEIIKNNKQIIFSYLKSYFFTDLLEAIPIYSIIRIFMKNENKIYYGYSDFNLNIITLFLFIKPFKIFKIISKKQNKALEDFYTYLSESYYLENLIRFLIYFIIFFLFIHLFVCLHIFLALLNYPNWIVHINIMNKTFLQKYIASFYFMVTTMTTVGYGDIVCVSPIERIYHIILLFIGTLLYTFLVSKIGNYLRDESHEQIKLSKDLNILENIRISYPTMPFRLYSKIKSHLLSIFKKRKKTGISVLINGVPDAIKNDLLFKIYSNVINNFSIFRDVKNSNFIHQMLTSFIPIISKKEEIITLEGEIIQNIIFVKDGRLSMEILIDLNDPYKSLQKYKENNFIGISRQEEIKNHDFLNRVNSIINNERKDYNNLKNEIDNFLLDIQKENNDNNSINNNGISVDLGRMDFSRNIIEQNDNTNFQIIKIMDIRKNEHFGDIHIFSEQPSPFTIKVKSRISELLILRKISAIIISKNFPNIWKRIQNKSYHNLVSIKNLTFKIIKQYFNTHFYTKNKTEKNIVLNLDITKNSIISNSDIKQSFVQKVKQINQENSLNKNINFKKLEQEQLSKNNENKLFVGYKNVKKNSKGSFSNELNYSYDSFNSNISQSQFEFPNSKRNNQKNESEKDNEFNKIDNLIVIKKNKPNNRKSLDNFTFKNDSESVGFDYSSPIRLLRIKKTKTKSSGNEFSKDYEINKSISQKNESFLNKSYAYYKIKTKKIKINNNIKDFITLKNINHNFSKKIRKLIKKRKKIQKLKQLLKLQRLKINKNLFDFYSKQNIIKRRNSYEITLNKRNNFDYSDSSSNYKILSQILNSSITKDGSSSSNKINYNFDINSLKIVSSESFNIKSSYKNINILTKGEIINNLAYRTLVENLIKKNLKINNLNEDNYNPVISLISKKTIKEDNKEENYKFSETENETKNEEIFYSEGKLITLSNPNYKNSLEDINYYPNKKVYINADKITNNFSGIIYDKKGKYKRSSKFFEKVSENYDKLIPNCTNIQKKHNLENIKTEEIKSNLFKGNIEGKQLYKPKPTIKSQKQEFNNNLDNKNIAIYLNKYPDSKNKNESSINENKLSFINKKINNSCSKMININDSIDKKINYCVIY